MLAQSRWQGCIYIGSGIFTDRCTICGNRNKAVNRTDVPVHSHNNKILLFFCHIKFDGF